MKIPLHQYQRRALESKNNLLVLAGTGGGKTHLGVVWLIKRISENPEGLFLVVGYSDDYIDSELFPLVYSTLQQLGLVQHKKRNNITLISGGHIIFKSAQSQIITFKPVAIWCDEVCQYPFRAWYSIIERSAMWGARILLTGTPGKRWVQREIVDRWRKGELVNWEVISFPSYVNPKFPSDIENLRRILPAEEFARRIMGQYTKPLGAVFTEFTNDNIYPKKVYDKPAFGGIDPGTNFAVVEVVIRNDEFIVTNTWLDVRGTTSERAAKLTPGVPYYCDPSASSVILDLQSLGINVKAAPRKEWLYSINKINELFKRGLLYIARAQYEFIDEIENYSYRQSPQGEWMDEPVKVDDHRVDALRYAILGYLEHPKVLPTVYIE